MKKTATKAKAPRAMSDEQRERLALKVKLADTLNCEQYEFIYNTGNALHKDKGLLAQTWDEIAKVCGKEADFLIKLWQGMREAYRKEKNARAGITSGSAAQQKCFCSYYESMTFLSKFSNVKKSISTLQDGPNETIEVDFINEDSLIMPLDVDVELDDGDLFPPGEVDANPNSPVKRQGVQEEGEGSAPKTPRRSPRKHSENTTAGPSSTSTPRPGSHPLSQSVPMLSPNESKSKSKHTQRSEAKRKSDTNEGLQSLISAIRENIQSRTAAAAAPEVPAGPAGMDVATTSAEMMLMMGIGKTLESIEDEAKKKLWKRKFTLLNLEMEDDL